MGQTWFYIPLTLGSWDRLQWVHKGGEPGVFDTRHSGKSKDQTIFAGQELKEHSTNLNLGKKLKESFSRYYLWFLSTLHFVLNGTKLVELLVDA